MTDMLWIPDSESMVVTYGDGTEIIILPEDVPELIDAICDATGISAIRVYDNFEQGWFLHVDDQ